MQVSRRQQFLFENVDPLLKLAEVEDVLKDSRVFYTVPSRPTLIEYCEDGTFEARMVRGQWFVYESSLLKFIRDLQRPPALAA